MKVVVHIPDIEKLLFIEIRKKEVLRDVKFKTRNGKICNKGVVTKLTNSLIPKKKGIYLIYNKKKKLIYIGQSENINHRVSFHRHKNKNSYYCKFFSLDKSRRYRIAIEYFLLDFYNFSDSFNKTKGYSK